MNDRERFVAWILGEPVDRPPYWVFWGPWSTTWKRWEKEGKPDSLKDMDDIRAYVGSDKVMASATLPVNTGPCPRIEPQVFEETDEWIIHTDSWNIKRRDLKTGESMSEFLDFPVKTREDWVRFRDTWLNPDDPRRLDGNWRELGRKWMEEGYPIQLGNYPDTGVFGPFRWLMGDEQGLIAFHTMPDLVHEIMDHITTIYLTVYEQVVKEVRVDVVHMWEDMCYRNGPLISPKMWDEFMGPNYRRIKAFMKQHDIPILSVDTDGNPDRITPVMIAAGVNFLWPMEVAAGCDVRDWRERYPTLGMMGGIDKRALAYGPQAIDKEMERIRPALEKGRYIPCLDHLVPDDVSWQNYLYYTQALKKLTGKE